MKSFKIFTVLLLTAGLIAIPALLSAQTEVRFFGSGEVSYKFNKRLQASLGQEVRLADGFSSMLRSATSAGLSWRFNKYLKASGGYLFIYQNRYEDGWEKRNRFYAQLTAQYKLGRFIFSLRERYQTTYRVGVSATSTRANPKMYLRSRVMCELDIQKSKFSPYLSAEYYNTINDPQKNELTKIRYSLGTNLKLDKKSSINLYFRYVTEKDDDDVEGSNIIGLSYSFNIN